MSRLAGMMGLGTNKAPAVFHFLYLVLLVSILEQTYTTDDVAFTCEKAAFSVEFKQQSCDK